MVYFGVSVVVLAALLFLPISKLIWTLSVRRLQKKLGRELAEDEIGGQLARARFIAVLLCLVFSFLFNAQIIGLPGHE